MEEPRGISGGAPPSLLTQYRHMLRALNELQQKRLNGETTLLEYKLDADERGVLRNATPGQSQLAVTNQEQANIRRLSAEAEARGEDVVNISVSYKAGVVDGKLVLRAGKTEVASLSREERDVAAAIYEANREAAQSLRLLDLNDDAGLRSLSGGLAPSDNDWQM